MKTRNTVEKHAIERVGNIELIREVDFEKLAKDSPDGKIDVEELQTAGDFVIEFTPSARDAKVKRTKVPNLDFGVAYVQGFKACAEAKKKPRKKKKPAEEEAK